jgi:hypothetical protein
MKKEIGNIAEAFERWTESKVLLDSGYYSGSGPSGDYLGSPHLEMIYAGLKIDVGEREAKNFVLFVSSLQDMSPASFIVAFRRFWAGGCKHVSIKQQKGDRFEVASHGQAEALIRSSLAGLSCTEDVSGVLRQSEWVKRDFINAHHTEILSEEVCTA